MRLNVTFIHNLVPFSEKFQTGYRRSSHAQLVNSGRKVRFLGGNQERTEMTEEIDIQ